MGVVVVVVVASASFLAVVLLLCGVVLAAVAEGPVVGVAVVLVDKVLTSGHVVRQSGSPPPHTIPAKQHQTRLPFSSGVSLMCRVLICESGGKKEAQC